MITESIKQFQDGLHRAIELVQRNLQQRLEITSPDVLMRNSSFDFSTNTLSCNLHEHDAMEKLTKQIESLFQTCVIHLDDEQQHYVSSFLLDYQYEIEKGRFQDNLTMNVLHSFLNDLKAVHDSFDAFIAAWNGNSSAVQKFLDDHPTFKDQPGPWGTTLLYSAAKNNHLTLVQDLISEAHCSVNAQNQQHLERALQKETITAADYQVIPKAGSTALHAACFGGHLQIVEYLIENNANYFLRNQAEETPIMNGEHHAHIIKYFEELLNLGYRQKDLSFPSTPITEGANSSMKDCLWEYKPLSTTQWLSFDVNVSEELNRALIVTPEKPFKEEIYIDVASVTDTVSITRFLRSRRDCEQNEDLAWIRCRGSSILNFDCFAVWQLLFTEHPHQELNTESSLEWMDLFSIADHDSLVHLNCWYTCDTKSNSQLDEAMNNRRRRVKLSVDIVEEILLEFDLHEFTFGNQQETIRGFLRWIPKLVANSDRLQTKSNRELTPLTTKRQKEISQHVTPTKPIDDDEDYQLSYDVDDDNGISNSAVDYKAMNNDINIPVQSNTNDSDGDVQHSVDDFLNESQTRVTESQEPRPVNLTEQIERLEECAEIQQADILEQSSLPDELDRKHEEALALAREQITQLNLQHTEEKQRWETIKSELEETHRKEKQQQEDSLFMALQHNTELARQIQEMKEQRETLQQEEENVQPVTFENIPVELMQNFIMPEFESLLDYLKDSVPNLNEHFRNRFPKVTFVRAGNSYKITVSGFPEHYAQFDAARRRIVNVFNCFHKAIEFYHGHLTHIVRSVSRTLLQVNVNTNCWKQYMTTLLELFEEKKREYTVRFEDRSLVKSSTLIKQSIVDQGQPPWVELRTHTNAFIAENPFENELEPLKQRALAEFIKQNINFERFKSDSTVTIEYFITQIRSTLATNVNYRGHQLEQFALIPNLLEQILIFYSCFTVRLPLFESCRELLETIERHTVITITTSTGSGKSSLLPALLIAAGYDRVLVTQPRRLPCRMICERVNKTIQTDIVSRREPLAGWSVSGENYKANSRILYLTDGLLKEYLLYDENFVTAHTNVNKSIVFFIDEVHERSVNIDLCLALLARLLWTDPGLQSKVKVIISSATLDPSVPALFRRILSDRFADFQMANVAARHHVTTIKRPRENILDVVQELYKKRQRHDQILCFVNSVAEVHQCCRLLAELSRGTIKASPLVQSQSASVQQAIIEHGSVFFSTTIAETSLTFPSLKYVIDTGMVNMPIYDPNSKRTVLEQVRAAESTIKQRFGRLGRTRDGEYYCLYDFPVAEKPFPIPHIRVSDLTNIEFSLRRSPMKRGLQYLQHFLPDPPSPTALQATIRELQALGILRTASDELTSVGQSLAKLPDFGSLAMSKAVLAALTEYRCGRDLIRLSSILSCLNTTGVLKNLPPSMKSSDGDFMTLLNVMNEVLLVSQSASITPSDLKEICQEKGLSSIEHTIRQAMQRYRSLQKSFNLSADFRRQAQIQSGQWKHIAKALLAGYSDNVFVSMKDLQGRTHRFGRYKDITDIAVLDLQSTLTRPISAPPVSMVLARDIRYSTAVRSRAILSFVGELKPTWVEFELQRRIPISAAEDVQLKNKNIFQRIRSFVANALGVMSIDLHATAGVVLKDELLIRQEMVTTMRFHLENRFTPGTSEHENLAKNLESVTKMMYIFQPMQWRWEAEKQVKITVNNNPAAKTCEITVEGRDSENQKVQKEFDSFVWWLALSVIVRPPHAGVLPRLLHPKMRKMYPEIQQRIAHVTNSERTMVELYKSVKSLGATRETRMEVVAWIAVCKFQCKLEGGFVRDWVVGGHFARPANLSNQPKQWVSFQPFPAMNKEVVPSDLDCHLPLNSYFDVDKFQDELYKFDITCKVYRQQWRYILLIDEDAPTGPFTMDLIEPHVVLTHDRIDFDVGNLSLEKDYPREIGMRMDITQSPYNIELESIVENIRNKRFQVLRPIDPFIQERIDKMIGRGWAQTGEPMDYIPRPHPTRNAVLVSLPPTSTLYLALEQTMRAALSSITIVSVEEIKNPLLEDTYESMKKIIARECANRSANERKLFHGTKHEGAIGIVENGFDDRFFKQSGAWGCGAYFAENPTKSHGYTDAGGPNQKRVMFYNKVILGNESIQNAANTTFTAAPQGYHSVRGTAFTFTEYIVYRYAQALPYLKITYTV